MKSMKGRLLFFFVGAFALLSFTTVEGNNGGGVIEADNATIEYNAKKEAMSRGARVSSGSCSCVYSFVTLDKSYPGKLWIESIPSDATVSHYGDPGLNAITQATIYDTTTSGTWIHSDQNSMTIRIDQTCTSENSVKLAWAANREAAPLTNTKPEAFMYIDSTDGSAVWAGEEDIYKSMKAIIPATGPMKAVTVKMEYRGAPLNWWETNSCNHNVHMAVMHQNALRTVCSLDCRTSSFQTVMSGNDPMMVWADNDDSPKTTPYAAAAPSVFSLDWAEM